MKKVLIILVMLVAHLGFSQTYVELILDASGSMWNQLADGEYRIVAAKDVLASFVSSLPEDPELNVGLRIYGSQMNALEAGACEDSQLFVPIAGIARDALLNTVRETNAKGATPIAYSLALAGQDFPSEGEKVIILVTDGEESCGGDVRATMESLRVQGVEFDLKIIGFDLNDRAIQSFEGLGSFENATSAMELASALGRAVEVSTATYTVSVAVTRDGIAAEDGVTVAFIDSVTGQHYGLSQTATGSFQAELPAGNYSASVADAFSNAPLSFADLSIRPDSENSYQFELAEEAVVMLSVSPSMPTSGSMVTVSFEHEANPEGRYWLTIVPVDTPDNVYLSYEYVEGARGSQDFRVPDVPSTLEARFLVALPEGGSRVIGRSEAFTTVAATASIEAPGEVTAGAIFEASWTGPDNENDYLTIVAIDAPEGKYNSYFYTNQGSTGQLTAPIEPGDYELRYVMGQSQSTLVAVPVTILAASASLQAPGEVAAGSNFEVRWTGPANSGDYVTIVTADAPNNTYNSYFYTMDSAETGQLTALIEPGTYELRYVTGQASKILARMPITITAVSASLEAPSQVQGGASFEVRWSGPANDGDYVTIVEAGAGEGAYLSYFYATNQPEVGTLTAPLSTGQYEVRYVADQNDKTLASATLSVIQPTVTLSAPTEVGAGERFEVGWEGPGGSGDYVTIVEVGAPEGSYRSYFYMGNSNPGTLTAPDQAGSYELRYVADEGDVTLYRQPITVR